MRSDQCDFRQLDCAPRWRDDYAQDEDVRRVTLEKDYRGEWWEVPERELCECVLARAYLDSDGVQFYLPAYLSLALKDIPAQHLWVLHLLDVGIARDDAELATGPRPKSNPPF
jgi:hypothetical protein